MIFYKKPQYIGFYKDGKLTGAAMIWGEKKDIFILEHLDYFDMVFWCSSGTSPSHKRRNIKVGNIEEFKKEN